MPKVLLVTNLSTSSEKDKPEVYNFSNLVKEVFPEFTRNCTPNSPNCLRFFHDNSSKPELEKYLSEKPIGIIFDKSCSLERIKKTCEAINANRRVYFLPNLISIGEKCPEFGVKKVDDMWGARALLPIKDMVLA